MPLSAKTIHQQLARMTPILDECKLDTLRKRQNTIGQIMTRSNRKRVTIHRHDFERFEAAWVVPRDMRREGVILYLHGGGYTCGDLDYALGFGSALADQYGVAVFCPAYRLAPEHPFPAALEDTLQAYQYLLQKGYRPHQIALCGESAGGGLCYSLCLRLHQLEQCMPCGIIAISPWTDLTASGPSYEENKENDVSMTAKRLEFFARCYAKDLQEPLVSPLFGELAALPPSLIFVGGDEIMLSDARLLHEKLICFGSSSRLVVHPDRWHGYILFGLREDAQDMLAINAFLTEHLSPERKLRWMRLDNAAKIYPASRSQNWSNMFRLSATLTEPVDPEVLQSALDVTVRRFPSIACRLRRGVFWYYLQQLSHPPQIRQEDSYPLVTMKKAEARSCAFRVVVYENRIAVEFFHALTDGNGGMVFFKTLLAEYLQQRYGVSIPAGEGVMGRLEFPRKEELEDSFPRYAGKVCASRQEPDAWVTRGTPEKDGFLNLTCFRMDTKSVLEKAHDHGVSLTAFLSAVMLMALLQLQNEKQPDVRKQKMVRLMIPVNLRNLFPSSTLRNFALYTTAQVDPRLGSYTLGQICKVVHHTLGLEVTDKVMASKIAANVSSEQSWLIRIMPLFLKNIVMKLVFLAVGERKSCLSLSNLGQVKLPEVMKPYITRMDFILGAQATRPHNCGVLSFGDDLYINFIRNIREPELEAHFFRVLRDLGLEAEVQSNLP